MLFALGLKRTGKITRFLLGFSLCTPKDDGMVELLRLHHVLRQSICSSSDSSYCTCSSPTLFEVYTVHSNLRYCSLDRILILSVVHCLLVQGKILTHTHPNPFPLPPPPPFQSDLDFRFRCQHGAEPLTYSSEVEKHAIVSATLTTLLY